MGPTGLKNIKNAKAVGPPAVEYELQIRRLGTFCEIPLKKYYEKIFYEGHGATHSNRNVVESTVQQRYWLPNYY